MRKIDKIIVHCADTPEGRDVRAEEIRHWHKAKGWDDIGYHYVIDIDGTIEAGRDTEIATDAQKESLRLLIKFLKSKYKDAKVFGHRDFAKKACPCFDAKTEYEEL